MSDASWLDADALAAIGRHMNEDHAADNVVICQGLGGHDDVVAAVFTGMTTTEAVFAATGTDGTETEVRVPFANEVTARPEVRTEIASLYHRSAAILGLPPRDGEH